MFAWIAIGLALASACFVAAAAIVAYHQRSTADPTEPGMLKMHIHEPGEVEWVTVLTLCAAGTAAASALMSGIAQLTA